MAIRSAYCPVRHETVQRVTDLEGRVVRIICSEYDEPNATCRLKKTAFHGGRLAQFLDRADEGTLDSRTTRCDLA